MAFIASAGDSIDQLFADRARLTTYDGSDLDQGYGLATPPPLLGGIFLLQSMEKRKMLMRTKFRSVWQWAHAEDTFLKRMA